MLGHAQVSGCVTYHGRCNCDGVHIDRAINGGTDAGRTKERPFYILFPHLSVTLVRSPADSCESVGVDARGSGASRATSQQNAPRQPVFSRSCQITLAGSIGDEPPVARIAQKGERERQKGETELLRYSNQGAIHALFVCRLPSPTFDEVHSKLFFPFEFNKAFPDAGRNFGNRLRPL